MNEQSTEHKKSAEYKSPDTELKFLEELVRKDNDTEKNSRTFSITKGAFNKAMTYAKAIGQIAGTGMECYGYLLKPSDSLDDTVTDIFLAPNQTNQSAYVRVSAEGVYQSSQEIEPRGMMIVGWWHSHGTFSTFHSGTDVRNFEVVLHSIAPRTMYQNVKGQYTYNPEKKELLTNGTKIKGLELPESSQLEILRKVERDPYAYSMVVNMYRSCYLEKITKTLKSREEGFVLNSPIRPTLELVNVENDVKYTISEIEDDITGKVDIHGAYSRSFSTQPYANDFSGKNRYADEDRNFRDTSDFGMNRPGKYGPQSPDSFNSGKHPGKYSSKYSGQYNNGKTQESFKRNGKYMFQKQPDIHDVVIERFVDVLKRETPNGLESFIEGIMNNEKSALSRLESASNATAVQHNADASNGKNLDGLSALLKDKFGQMPEKYVLDRSYDIQRLRDEMTWHFIEDYSKNPSVDVIRRYARMNSVAAKNFDTAVNAGKALAKYSMERFTDYNDESPHKYTNFIGHFLENMNTADYVPMSASLVKSKNSRYDKAAETLFLYNERLKIINNVMSSLMFRPDESKFRAFLDDFSREYQKDPSSVRLDTIIEEKLLSTADVHDYSSYTDRTSYERKGILEKIFGEVRNYFGGAKNAS